MPHRPEPPPKKFSAFVALIGGGGRCKNLAILAPWRLNPGAASRQDRCRLRSPRAPPYSQRFVAVHWALFGRSTNLAILAVNPAADSIRHGHDCGVVERNDAATRPPRAPLPAARATSSTRPLAVGLTWSREPRALRDRARTLLRMHGRCTGAREAVGNRRARQASAPAAPVRPWTS